jgi:hypothetical protein
VAVAASEPDDSRAWFSTYGGFVAVYAPGDNIWTTQHDSDNPYAGWSGTSFASPIVAGVAALMLSVNPALSNSQIAELLKQTADDVGPAGYDSIFAYGRVNAWRAVNAARPDGPLEPPQPPTVPQPPLGDNANTETIVPTVAILSGPVSGARLFSPNVTLGGSAADNAGIARVEVQVNNGPFQRVDGITRWQTQLSLAPGNNVVRVRSVDLSGNVSALATRTFTWVVMAPLKVLTIGLGTVYPNLNGALLEIGKTYQVKAVPSRDQVFAGWEGIGSTSVTLGFVMQSNLSLVAKFVSNPFPAVRGNYTGLVANEQGVTPKNSGYFTLTITTSGQFTGKLMMGGTRQGFRGQFDLNGDAMVSVRRNLQPALNLKLHLDLTNGSDQVTGSLTDGRWTSALAGDRNVFDTLSNPARQAGDRSFVLDRADNNTRAATGLSRINLNGATRVQGTLTDGRAFSTSSTLARNGDCPFYLSLNSGNEVVIGWLNFPIGQGPTATGTVLWVRTGTNSFAATLQATGL